jgi:protein-S-isoprenylcysteine O-methyltransferase Ste14
MTPVGVVAGLAGVVLLLYGTLFLDDATATWLIREDHAIELAGALSLLAASVACLVIWRQVRGDVRWPRLRRASLLVLAALFFFGFGEEISWGERILGFAPPDSVREANRQGETNVHNLNFFAGTVNPDRVFQLFWLAIGVVVPLLGLWQPARSRLQRFLPILPAALAPLFVLNQLLTWGFDRLFASEPDLYRSSIFPSEFAVFEVKETAACLLLAAGFWLLARAWRAGPAGIPDRFTTIERAPTSA